MEQVWGSIVGAQIWESLFPKLCVAAPEALQGCCETKVQIQLLFYNQSFIVEAKLGLEFSDRKQSFYNKLVIHY